MPSAVEPGPLGVRAVLAERADAHGDQAARRGRPARCASARACPGRKFSTTTSAVAASRRNRSWPSGCAQVEGDALAARGPRRPRTASSPSSRVAVVREERADLAHEVAGAGLLDLDDLGALLAEQARRRTARRCGCRDRGPGVPVSGPAIRPLAARLAGLLGAHRVHAAGARGPRCGRARRRCCSRTGGP